jgi:hypothetical protein
VPLTASTCIGAEVTEGRMLICIWMTLAEAATTMAKNALRKLGTPGDDRVTALAVAKINVATQFTPDRDEAELLSRK